jgi:hypothetical protein
VDLQSPMSQAVARLSDRALARIVGANAYLRGRVYARQQMVHDIAIDGSVATAKVHGRASDPYDVRLEVNPEGVFTSQCSCPAWRGPDRHCKHVAALLVALRERYRPPRPPQQQGQPQQAQGSGESAPSQPSSSASGGGPQSQSFGGGKRGDRFPRRNRREESQGPREVVVVDRSGPRVVSSTGPTTVQAVSAGPGGDGRAGFEIWLPRTEPRKPPEFEYRVQLRSQSIAVTVFSAETRAPMTPHDAYEALGAHVSPHRGILYMLTRLAPRSQRIQAIEARGEEAAELLTKLRGRRVLLEPALMELRYLDEPLQPRMEMELVPPQSIRVRAVFERKGDGRRFTMSQGLWLEGMPGWHVDPTQGIARQLADNITPPWLERLSRAPAITHPMAEIGRLLSDIVPRVALSLNAPLPEISSIVDIVDATPTFILRAAGDLVGVQATLKASYGEIELDIPPVELPPPLAIIPGDSARPRCVRRDVGAERAAVEKLLDLGLEVSDDFKSFKAEGQRAVSFWTEGIGTLPDDWDRFIPDDLVDVTVRDTPVSAKARVSSGVDWLSVDVEFGSEGSTVSEAELRQALLEGRHLVKLADGTYAPIGGGEVQDVLNRMAEIFAGGKKKLPLSQAGRVQDLVNALERGASVAPSAREFFDKLGGAHKVPHVPVPKKLKATMRPYQEEGLSWLVFMHKMQTGGVLADDMGLGKTLQAIALLLWVKDQETGAAEEPEETPVVEKKTKTVKSTKKKAAAKDAAVEAEDVPAPKAKAKKTASKSKKTAKSSEPQDDDAPLLAKLKEDEPESATKPRKEPRKGPLALVIAPTSVVPNWVREIGKFAPSLRAIAWTGGDREKYKHELERVDVVVTSYALLRRDEELLRGLECGYVVLDEAQHIKNPLSATARAAKSLNGEHRMALTGTPIENRLSEIWSIFDFLAPGLLGPLSQFEERYSRPIDRGDPDAAKRLRNAIHPFVLRRTKNEVAKDLPEKIVSELLCEMPSNQAAVYKTVLKAVRDEVLGEVERVGVAKSQLQILAGLTRLRQAACDPRLLKVPGDFNDDDSGKLEALRELLAEASQSGHRTLVFSQFVSMLTLIRRALEEDGLKYEYIDGSTTDRQERVDRFNKDENIPVFLISLKAGGTGLNLTGADTVVHFDPWWNPAVEDQATDRAHRIGQTKVVTAYRLVARGTIEEKILSLSSKKRELVANVLGKEEEGGLRGFTKAEVENLLAED